ncbi:MAG: tripartite tricarboxylate transporter substrate binding protein [Defluviitaleaceae bacterium]|nr:tripartite tricarboxylate transporter substrate binding protein [Defluviitaleaceae bacterium]
MKSNFKKAMAMTAAVAASAVLMAACAQPAPSAPASAAPAEAPAAPAEAPADPEPSGAEVEFPTRDISVVVPWGPGGETDLTVRTLTNEMANFWGITMPITNMAGAGGSVGLAEVHNQTPDGYTILGTSAAALANAQVLGLVDVSYREWHGWAATFSPNVVVVRADSPFQTIDDLVDAMTANPGSITGASAGPGSSGHLGAVVFAEGVGAEFLHIPYEGGAAAIIGTLAGEVDFNAQLSSEMIDYLRSGDLRGLAALTEEDLVITGGIDGDVIIPSILNYAPGMTNVVPFGGVFGLYVHEDTHPDVLASIDEAYQFALTTDSMAAYIQERGLVLFGFDREQTAAYLETTASIVNWTLYDIGSAHVSPEYLGIPRP